MSGLRWWSGSTERRGDCTKGGLRRREFTHYVLTKEVTESSPEGQEAEVRSIWFLLVVQTVQVLKESCTAAMVDMVFGPYVLQKRASGPSGYRVP